jgi:hypothetical protein
VKDKGMAWPVLADGKGFDGAIATGYHVQGTPELFVLDREGRIFGRTGSAQQIEPLLQQALAPR